MVAPTHEVASLQPALLVAREEVRREALVISVGARPVGEITY
jgi:hypothetical protein